VDALTTAGLETGATFLSLQNHAVAELGPTPSTRRLKGSRRISLPLVGDVLLTGIVPPILISKCDAFGDRCGHRDDYKKRQNKLVTSNTDPQ
jgi:hypothetical protein